MKKYLKLYYYFLKFSLSKSLQFRFDFSFKIVMDLIFYVTNIAFFKVIFSHTGILEGWTEEQVLIFASGYLVVDALQMTLFNSGVWLIPIYINKGDLDYYLLRPVSDLFFLCLREFAFNSFVNLIVAIGICGYFLATSSMTFPWWSIVLFGILLFNGAYIHLLIRILTSIPVFWTHSGRGLEMAFWTIERFSERPDMIYKGWVRYTLMFVLPFIAMSSFPARILFESSTASILSYCLGVSLVFTLLVNGMWRWGLKNYSSASS